MNSILFTKNIISLAKIGTNPTVNYAVDELARCLKLMDKRRIIDKRHYSEYDPSAKGVIWVGIDGSVNPSDRDDEIKIDVKGGEGIITGANNRAVLIAAYRFLRELGCAWVRPGVDGEIIPEKSLEPSTINVSVRETPDYPHRGICIEGATTNEHVLNVIEWMPRIGLNSYFIQNFVPTDYYNLWYSHRHNPFMAPENIGHDAAIAMWSYCEEELFKRGIVYHAVGHGWNYHLFDVHSSDAAKNSPEFLKHVAMINGKREIFKTSNGADYLVATQLCYSNPETRDVLTSGIVKYCIEHPKVDIVHFWLADGMNNHCECDECKKMRPSDYYVMMLNELDKKLTEKGIKTKIVFLVYVDLLWAPEKLKIENPDRFIIMFAPISRTYSHALSDYDHTEKVELMPYERNKLTMPKAIAPNIAHLAEWQKDFTGDGFVYDYHLMWDHFLDPGAMSCARVLHQDMCELELFGLMGNISCQQHRVAFPTGIAMYAMAAGLWSKNSKFEDISREYHAAMFGKDGPAVEAYLSKISELFDPKFMRNDNPEAHRTVKERMAAINKLTDEFKASHIDAKRDTNASWNYLWYHADFCKEYAKLILAYESDDQAVIDAATDAFTRYHFGIEPEIHSVFDNMFFDEVYQRWIKRVYSNKPTVEVDF